MSTISVNLSDCIAPPFYELHKELKEDQWSEVWCKGGRGSTKSTFISIEIILGMIRDEEANAIVGRKYENEIHDSVYSQLLWAIDKLGVESEFHSTVSPMRITRKATGQKIIFKGADKPTKMKSLKIKKGYIKYFWGEEVDQWGGVEDLRSFFQSFFRGTNKKQVAFFSYNPPKSARSWVNQEVKVKKPGRRVHHSDYRDVPVEWLGDRFIVEAGILKERNENAYDHEYLGKEVGTGLEVFNNVEEREITDKEISYFSNIYQGLDFGYALDPLAFNEMHYDSTRRILYIYDEVSGIKISNRVLADRLTEDQKLRMTTADSAEPKSIDELKNDYGMKIKGAEKGAGSVEYGIKWLQDLDKIVIDPVRCPRAAKEFVNYALETNKAGEVISKYPDKDNHTIDDVRYALEAISRLSRKKKDVKVNVIPVANRW